MDPSIIHEVNIERGEKQQAELNDWNTTTHLIYWLFGHLLWTGNSLNVWLQDDRENLTVVWFCEQQVAPESNKTLDHPQFVSHVTFTSLCEELLLIRGGEHINFHLIYAFLIIATLYFHSTTFIWQLQLLVTFLWKKFDFSNLDRGGKYEVHQQKVTKHRRWNTAEEHNTFIKKVMAMFACFLSFVRYKYVESLFIPNLCRHFAQEVIQLMEVGVINNTIQNNRCFLFASGRSSTFSFVSWR